MKSLNKTINPSNNTNPFNHNTSYIKLYTSLRDLSSNKDDYGQLINPRYLDDIFNFETSMSRLTRKVRVDLGRRENLHMREVRVLDYNNVNRALFKNATQSTNYGGKFPASYAVDGKNDTFSQTENWDSEFHISACKILKYHVLCQSSTYFSPLFLHKTPGGR